MKQKRLLRPVSIIAGSLFALSLLVYPSVAQNPDPAREDTTPHAATPTVLRRQVPIASALKVKRVAARTLLAIVDQPTIEEDDKLLADRTLKALPSLCRDNLKNFYIRYDEAAQRGLGGKTTIIVKGTVADEELLSLLVHECGHVIHGNLTGTPRTGLSGFMDGLDVFFRDSAAARFFAISWETERVRRDKATINDFASGYALSDAFEDFAESFAAFVLHRDMLSELANTNAAIAAKLRWMETYLPMEENILGTDAYVWKGEVPWDITKLPIQL